MLRLLARIVFGCLWLLTMPLTAHADSTPTPQKFERMILALVINSTRVEESALVLKDPGGFYVARETLTDGRLIVSPQARTIADSGVDYVALGSLPGVTVALDTAAQELQITATGDAITRQVIDMSPRMASAFHTDTKGGFLNYDALAQAGSSQYFAGIVDGGASIADGMLLTSGIGKQSRTDSSFKRLESAWVHDVPSEMMRVKVGDAISRGGDWGHPTRFGGVQVATNFTVQPGFIPFPLPNFSGSASLPSTVDVFINNTLRTRSSVDQGPFSLNQIPTITGGGEASIVVTDLLGRQQVVNTPFYVTPSLLKDGLSDFSYEVGSQRMNLGLESNHYSHLVGSATHRYGINDNLTGEGHAEIIGSHKAAGGALTANMFDWGILQGDAAVGGDSHHRGVLAGIGFSRQMAGWNFGLTERWRSEGFAASQSLASNSVGELRNETVGNPGVSLGDFGSISASMARDTYFNSAPATIGSLTWTKSLTQWAFVSGYATSAKQTTSNTTLGVSMSFLFSGGNSISTDSSVTNGQPQGMITARHSDGPETGLTYGLTASRGMFNRLYGDITARTQHGDFGGAVDQFNGQTNERLTASGGFAFADGTVFASRRLDDSFAVVTVPGFPDVTVTQENRPVGKTDSQGRILLPRLISYYPNKIGLDGAELPITAEIDQLEQTVTPTYRSPIHLVFDAHAAAPRLVVVQRPDGEPITAGVQIKRLSDGKLYRAAFDGEAYLDVGADADGNRFVAQDGGGACRFTLPPAILGEVRSVVTCGHA